MVNPEALGWRKRSPLGSAPPERTPRASRMSVQEQFHKFAEEPMKSVIRPKLGLSFDSLGEAYNFTTCICVRWAMGLGMVQIERSFAATRASERQQIVGLAGVRQ